MTKLFAFIAVAFLAFAVQAANTQFMGADTLATLEQNKDVQIQACGSSGCPSGATYSIDTATVTGDGATVTFDALAGVTYYFAVRTAAGQISTPSAADIVANLGNFVQYSVVATADGVISFDFTGLNYNTWYEVFAVSVDGSGVQSVVDPVGTFTTMQHPPNVSATTVFAADGSYTSTYDVDADGTLYAFAYWCCGPSASITAGRGTRVLPTADCAALQGDVNQCIKISTSMFGVPSYGTPIPIVRNTAVSQHVIGNWSSDVPSDLGGSIYFIPELNTYQFVLVFVGDDGQTTQFHEFIVLPDLTAPVVTVDTATTSADTITVAPTADDVDTVFYTVAVPTGDAAPTEATVISTGVTDGVVSGLSDGTTYDVYVVGVSAGGQSMSMSTFTTVDVTAPVVSSVTVGGTSRTTATVNVVVDDTTADVYALVLPSGSTAPAAETVMVSGALFNGTLSGLTAGTSYDVYVVAVDASSNFDFTVQSVSVTTDPLYTYNTFIYAITEDAAVTDSLTHADETTMTVSATSGVAVQTGIPSDASGNGPDSATLTFFVEADDGATYSIAAITEAWTEVGVTATCAALYVDRCINADWDILNGGSTATVSSTATVVDGKVTFDVTSDVLAFLAGTAENHGWFITCDGNGVFFSAESDLAPELGMTYQADVSTGSNTVEPICENASGSFSCPTGMKISITSASYGRHNTFACEYPYSWAMTNTECDATTSFAVTAAACNGLETCTITPTNTMYGDPCVGTFKYLDVAYTCVSSFSTDFCSGFVAGTEQATCTNSAYGPVYGCQDGFEGDDCSTVTPVFSEPMIAYYPFDDETAVDKTGNGHDGVTTDGQFVKGVSGRAIDVSDDRKVVVAPASTFDLTTEFTAAFWVKVHDFEDKKHTSVLLSTGVFGDENGRHGFGVFLSLDNKYSTGARVSVRFEREKGRQTVESAFPTDNNWHFIAVTFTADEQVIYVDTVGQTATKMKGHGGIIASTQGLYIGSDYSPQYWSSASIDEVRIYNVALTASEISEVFSADAGLLPTQNFYTGADLKADSKKVDDIVMDPSSSGCADGSREGFKDETTYESIAACYGGWDVEGVLSVASFNKKCDAAAGNDGTITGCSVADVCAAGWHVCFDAAEVVSKTGVSSGCDAVTDFEDGFFVTRQSGPGAKFQSTEGTNDVFGCGQGSSFGTHNGLQSFTHNKCNGVSQFGFECQGRGDGYDEALVITHSSNVGGAMCCRDDRKHNGGGHSDNTIVQVKIEGKGHDEEDMKKMGQDMEDEINRKKHEKDGHDNAEVKVTCTRKRSGGSNKSGESKKGAGRKSKTGRNLLQTTTDYTYVVYDIQATTDFTSDEVLLMANEEVVASDSLLNTNNAGVTGFYALHSCEDGTIQESCDGIVLATPVDLPAGTSGDGYGSESSLLGNSSDIVTAVVSTSIVFVLLIVIGFAYRARNAKDVDMSFDARIMNSDNNVSDDVEMSGVGPKADGEQDTYWVFNRGQQQQDVRVVA